MKSGPYTLLTRARPIRAAFLINTDQFAPGSEGFHAVLDAVVDWNNTHWGGRANHIAFFPGGALSDDEWRQLEFADPDCVLAFAPLSETLIRELDERLSPWSIEVVDASHADPDGANVRMDGIAMPPTVDNLRRLRARNAVTWGKEAKLLMFEFSEGCDLDIRRFVHRNFGTYHQWLDVNTGTIRRVAWLEQLLHEIPTRTFTISDVDSLAAALTEVSGRLRPRNIRPPLPFLAPYQLASLFLESWPTSEWRHSYQVIVGDTPTDFSEHWNGVLLKRNWTETHRHQLWIPTKLAGEPAFRESLHDWLYRYTGCGDAGHRVELLSTSLSLEALADIRAYFRQHELPLHVQVVPVEQTTQRRDRAEKEFGAVRQFFPWTSEDDVMRFTVSSQNETVSLAKPDALQGENGDGSWMVDVQIEHVSRVRSTLPQQSWWHLPRLRSGGVVHAIFRAPARMSRLGRFSVRVEAREPHLSPRIKPELKVQLPSEAALIHCLVTGAPNRLWFTSDARAGLPRRQAGVSDCRTSTKGAYLGGLIELFGDFWTAKGFCERRFWRELFNRLAGHGAGNDEKLYQGVVELLKANVSSNDEARSEKAVALAEKVLHLVRGRLKGHYVGFRDCLREQSKLGKQGLPETIAYLQGHTVVHRHGETPVTREDMEEGLDALLDSGVLRLGIESRCPRCKLSSWHHVDVLSQHITCAGCGSDYALGARESWSYALNSLAQMSVSQGVLSVLHALTALASHARSFFAFSPSLDLFRESEDKVWHEVDVLCVADGEFVIGEVKDGFVQKAAFDELAEVADLLRPQRAIIFLPVENASKQWTELSAWLKDVQMRLGPSGVRVEIFTLPAY